MEEQEEERSRVEEEQERLRVSGQEKDSWLVVLLEQLLPPCSQQRAALVTALQNPGPIPPPFQLSSLCLAVQTAPPAKRLVSEAEVRLGAWVVENASIRLSEGSMPASAWMDDGTMPVSVWVEGACKHQRR